MLNIIPKRKISFTVSSLLFAVSLVILFTVGLKPGIDFTGGSLLEVEYTAERPTNQEIQTELEKLDIGNVLVQPSDDKNMIIRMKFLSETEHQTVLSALRAMIAEESTEEDTAVIEENNLGVETIDIVGENGISVGVSTGDEEEKPRVLEERFETIGPTVSANLRSRSISAAIAVIVAIILYVGYAFRKVSKPVQSWKYGLTAVIALFHDVTITMAIFAILGKVYGVEVDIPFVVALLTIMGYSVNDTIVVFDRVRETLVKRGSDKFAETVNIGVNQTLTRSLNTSITTLLVLLSLLIFGGDSVHYFALTLIIGIIIGTYSSIFLASPLLVVWSKLGKK